jgi:hypothetical protein
MRNIGESIMAFRADESARMGAEEITSYFIDRLKDVSAAERAESKSALLDLLYELGPVVSAYPTWHPLVSNHPARNPETVPNTRCGYQGLDHTRYFAHGFITCPYGDGQDVIDSVEALPFNPAASITASRLNFKLYNPGTTPVLVKCEWREPLPFDKLIPLAIATPLLLEKEVPCWRGAQVAETWETMRPYFLGRPHGSRSSLFVSQETGQALKKVWEAIIYTGMYGPIKV